MPSVIRRSLGVAVLLCCGTAVYAKPAPNLKFQDLAGHAESFSGLRGSVTVVTFWATWCAPCREELPRMAALAQRYAPQGVRFVAVSVDEEKDRGKIGPYLKSQNVALDVWVGADIDTLGRLKLGDEVPATIVLDKDGEMVGRVMGEAQDADITGYLDWLLHGQEGAAPPATVKHY